VLISTLHENDSLTQLCIGLAHHSITRLPAKLNEYLNHLIPTCSISSGSVFGHAPDAKDRN
jgi:hypothetical protein